jgi:hypothetical protein
MFGYLNLNDPTKIGNNESQECKNVRLDRGYIELFNEFETNSNAMRVGLDINNFELFVGALDSTVAKTAAPTAGYLKRATSSTVGQVLGIYSLGNINVANGDAYNLYPTATAVVASDTRYSPGFVQYMITVYDPLTGEESAPTPFGVTIAANEAVQFDDFPAIAGTALENRVKLSTGAEYRVYRRAPGSAEFLRTSLSASPVREPSAWTGDAGPFKDETYDYFLGEPCPTGSDFWGFSGLTWHPSAMMTSALFTIHSGRLWARQENDNRDSEFWGDSGGVKRVLRYSDRNHVGQFNSGNWFGFNSEIVGLHSVNEALYVLCKEDLFVIYGDDETDFVVKQLTDSRLGCVGGFSSVAIGSAIFFLGSSKEDRDKADGVYSIIGSGVQRISFNVDSLFPLEEYSSGLFGAGTVRDRFAVFRLDNDSDKELLVYDASANGFLLAEDNTTGDPDTFYYRSKEYGTPGKWDDMRRAFVRGCGDFKVELYYDMVKVDEIDFTLDPTIPETEDFTVPPYRGNYFSFRFIGQSNAKIYEFGRRE